MQYLDTSFLIFEVVDGAYTHFWGGGLRSHFKIGPPHFWFG